MPRKLFGGDKALVIQKYHDTLKRDYARANGYTLISIPYTVNTIDDIKQFINDRLPK